MSERIFHYIPFHRLPDALRIGWLPSGALAGCIHGEYSVLAERVCECGRMAMTIGRAA